MATMIRNTLPNSAILSVRGHDALIFAGRGDAAGQDYQMVDDDLLKTPEFIRARRSGALEAVAEERMEDVLAHQDESSRVATQQAAEAAEGVLHRTVDRTMVGVTCIGPGARPTLTCEAPVVMSAAQKDLPPLCGNHAHLANQYFLTEVEAQKEDGTPITKSVWRKVEVTARSRA